MNAPQSIAAAFTDEPRPPIDLVSVESNQVKAIGYDEATQTLAVTFTRGTAVYHYPGVSKEAHAAFVGAESIGTYFGKHIKPLPFKKFPAEAVAA
jgi:hypothetical protein